MIEEVEEFIWNYEGEQREIMLFLHNRLVSTFHLECKLSYKIPFYYFNSWICYFNPTKDNKVEFAFPRGNEPSNFQGILKSKGRKQVYGITYSSLKNIDKFLIDAVIREAILLDETTPYASKRTKSKKERK